ncbi:MAG: AraC family transcriptional regulator, partial [Sphaerochaetaceae bacterium]
FMAELLNLNSNYLCELFKKESGVGYVEYLNTIRINKAKSLLLESDATVEAISSQVGFTSASHFSRIFKKMVGQTISDFRATSTPNQNIEYEN